MFALSGLYMYFERGSSGLDVRTAHGIMANSGTAWPKLSPPDHVGDLTAYDVLQAGSVAQVGKLTVAWAEQVWNAWPEADREVVRRLTVETVPPRCFAR